MNVTTKIYANSLAIASGMRLDGDRLRRVAEAKTVAEAFKMLGDYGFVYDPDGTIDGFIIEETNRLIDFIREESASDSLTDALIAEYVYNNAKLAYKSRFVDIPSDSYYRTGTDAKKIADGDYSECDPVISEALVRLDEAAEKRPQRIDIAITRAMYKRILSHTHGKVKKYFRVKIDMTNILSAARMIRLGTRSTDEFIDGGTIRREAFDEALGGTDFAAEFEGTPYEEMAERLEKSEFKAFSEYERDEDGYLLALNDSLVAAMTSYMPFLDFYTRRRMELKLIKIALVCIKTDARQELYSRIPESFG